jgi:hypothetical protein
MILDALLDLEVDVFLVFMGFNYLNLSIASGKEADAFLRITDQEYPFTIEAVERARKRPDRRHAPLVMGNQFGEFRDHCRKYGRESTRWRLASKPRISDGWPAYRIERTTG